MSAPYSVHVRDGGRVMVMLIVGVYLTEPLAESIRAILVGGSSVRGLALVDGAGQSSDTIPAIRVVLYSPSRSRLAGDEEEIRALVAAAAEVQP